MRFVDIKNDVAFRKIFGNENKTGILISFLNAVLKLEGDKRIKEVHILNPYQLPRIVGEKATIIDVRAKDMKGKQFIIEMQIADVNGFDKRVQYYTCRDYSMQIKKGQDYPLLKPTYFVGILDFNYFDSPSYFSHHIIVSGKTYEHKLKDIQFAFIELKKFTKKVHELKTPVEKWTFFIKNAKNLDVIPENINDAGLREAYKDAEKFNWNKEELIQYDNFYIAIQDAKGRIDFAEERGLKKGIEKGMKKGIEKGIEKEKIEVVKKCRAKNMAIEDIADITGLSLEEIQAIIEVM